MKICLLKKKHNENDSTKSTNTVTYWCITCCITTASAPRKRSINVKITVQLFTRTHLTAVERHLPYGITQCYLPPDTGKHAPPQP